MLLIKRLLGQCPDRLIWEYLDGEITPKRAGLLSRMLARKESVRQRLIEFAVLHGMLRAYFGGAEQWDGLPGFEAAGKRTRQGRTSAA